VRHHQIALQFGQVGVADALSRQLAETGIDPVDHRIVFDNVLNCSLCGS